MSAAHLRHVGRILILMLSLLVAVLGPAASSAKPLRATQLLPNAEARRTIAVVPSAAAPGTQLQVVADGWPAGAMIKLTIRTLRSATKLALGSITADASGGVDAALTLPRMNSGSYVIDFSCSTCQPPITGTTQRFSVLPPAPPDRPSDQSAADQLQATDLARWKQASATPISVQVRTAGVMGRAGLRIATPAAMRTPIARAQWFLNEYRNALRLENPTQQLQLVGRSQDGQHLLFRQRHNGIPVYLAELAVHLDGAAVTGVNGNYLPTITLGATPRINAEQAEELARARAGRGARVLGDTQLRYLNLGLLGSADHTTYLAWRVSISRGNTYFIDAYSGSRLYEETDEDNIDIDLEDGKQQTLDYLCAVDPDDNITPSPADPDSVLAYNSAAAVWQWWQGTTGLNSYNGYGAQMEMYLHVGHPNVRGNASYQHSCDVFFFTDGFPVLDIVGHEFTHAVNRSWLGAHLKHANQPGALDESYADIFGWMVEAAQVNYKKSLVDWTIGEDLPAVEIPPCGARDMSNPTCVR